MGWICAAYRLTIYNAHFNSHFSSQSFPSLNLDFPQPGLPHLSHHYQLNSHLSHWFTTYQAVSKSIRRSINQAANFRWEEEDTSRWDLLFGASKFLLMLLCLLLFFLFFFFVLFFIFCNQTSTSTRNSAEVQRNWKEGLADAISK